MISEQFKKYLVELQEKQDKLIIELLQKEGINTNLPKGQIKKILVRKGVTIFLRTKLGDNGVTVFAKIIKIKDYKAYNDYFERFWKHE